MKSRAEIDALAWKIIEDKIPQAGSPPGYDISGRPANFHELFLMTLATKDFERSLSDFLHEFYRFKSPSFFEIPPPSGILPQRRAWLAGVAEYLCGRFRLPVQEEWDFAEETFGWAGLLMDMSPFRDERRARSHEAFRRRGVIYEPRGLIAL
jgi:hypothetical protein